MPGACLLVSVPVCGFKKPFAREFLETERVPPPATVYGFLLSLIGEEDRCVHAGQKIALAVLSTPKVSRILRTTWRVKDRKMAPGCGRNRKPDYQEILTGLELGVWLSDGALSDLVRSALENPCSVSRFGGLCLGESRDLVNDVRLSPDWKGRTGSWLCSDAEGEYPLPLWVDHVGSRGTRWGQFNLIEGDLEPPPSDDPRWIEIAPA